MQLYLGEQSEEQVLKLFDELDELTRAPFHEAKAEIDAALAKSAASTVAELRPWHYHDPFFQEAPAVLGELPECGLQAAGSGEDQPASSTTASGCRSTTCWHAAISTRSRARTRTPFRIDIDRQGDIRVLENVVPNHEWLATTLHESGPLADYSEETSAARACPYVLRHRRPSALHRGRGHDVRAVWRRTSTGCVAMGVEGAGARPVPHGGGQAAAEPPAGLLPLLPGDVPLRDGAVRQSRSGPEPAVVGPGGEVSGDQAARGPRRARLSPASII